MPKLIVITHPEVVVDPSRPITDWGLNDLGRRRAKGFATSSVMGAVTRIWTSDETKAGDTATLLARPRQIDIRVDSRLRENDRSATGYLPAQEFEATADAFFANPMQSIRGWERAVDAQTRISAAVDEIVATHDHGDLAIVTHGAVGTLLWCALMGRPIDRCHDQPYQGHYWRTELKTLKPLHGWIAIG